MKRFWNVARLSGIALLAPVTTKAVGDPYGISIFQADGTLIIQFVATGDDMHIDDVEIGPDGNIWVARADNSHSFGVPNPNDMVAVFDTSGTELDTIRGGGMRDPAALAWDGGNNLYVAGQEIDFTTYMYKYDSSGGFLFKFRTAGWTLIDVYNDVVVTTDDRIYVSAWWGTGTADQMTEFDTAGGTVNTFSPTGPSYFHRDTALDGSTIWVYTPRNGAGDDLMRSFNLAGTQTGSFVTTSLGDFLRGLESSATGNLFMINSQTSELLEITTGGALVSTLPLPLDPFTIGDFTFDTDGTIVVAHLLPQPPCPWDLDGNGTVGTSDLLELLAAWGPCLGGGECPADFDESGSVGTSDLLKMLANWGPCGPS